MGVPKAKAGTVIAGRYRLVAPLSRGGMGSVWRAEHLSLGSPIAIKLIDAALVEHAEARARFEREARAAAALRSPHVVQILDHGVDKNLPFMAMELLEGESLATRLHRVRVLPAPQTVRLFQDVARAIRKAHDAGIIHRDLKPDNIFLVKNDDLEIAKVLDFGIAKSQEPFGAWSGGTRTGALIGTPQYMSPEQAQGHAIDRTTDLWALGVIAFECVCGRLPFPSDKPGELILQICAHPIPVPSRVARVPPRFDAWFARACHRDPKQRFSSAKELAETLAEALGAASADVSGPVQALSPGTAAASPPLAAGPAVAATLVAPPAAAALAPVSPGLAVGPSGTLLPHAVSPAVAEPVSSGLPTPVLAGTPPRAAPLPPPPAQPAGHVAPAPAPPGGAPSSPGTEPERDATTLFRSGGTMSGGAVMDSDPATFVALVGARTKKVKIALAGAAIALVGLVLFLLLSGDPPGGPASPDGSGPSPAVSPSAAPSVVVTPAEPTAGATATSSPTASASASGTAAPGGSAASVPSGGATKTGPRGTAAPKGTAAPRGSASVHPLIGF